MEINNIGKIFDTKEISGVSAAKNTGKINSVFGGGGDKFRPNTIFNGEEQHVLGILAGAQDNILIED